MTSTVDRSPSQTQQLEYISQFTTDIQHIAGKNNVVADYLSRVHEDLEVNSVQSDVSNLELKSLIELQKLDTEIQQLVDKISDSSKYVLKEVELPLTLGK